MRNALRRGMRIFFRLELPLELSMCDMRWVNNSEIV